MKQPKVIDGAGGGPEEYDADLLWQIMVFNAMTQDELDQAKAMKATHPARLATDADIEAGLFARPATATVRRAYEGQPRESGRFAEGKMDGGETTKALDVTGGMSIAARVAEQGGATYDPATGREPTTGYIVAQEGFSKAIPGNDFLRSENEAKGFVKEYLRANAERFSVAGAMVGLWQNPETTNVVLDVVDHVADRAEATRLGSERDQIGVWDVVARDMIPTGGTGGGQSAVEPGPGAAARGGGVAAQAGLGDVRRGARPVRRRVGPGFRPVSDDVRLAAATTRGARARVELKRAERALSRLSRVRRDVARQLLGGAEAALAEALKAAGVRATTKARNRSGAKLQQAVAAAYAQRQSLTPFFGALGLTESDLLRGAFDPYRVQATSWLSYGREEQRQVMGDAGYDSDLEASDDDEVAADAAGFLVLALLALARQRILSGTDHANPTGPGEVSGAVPASIIADTLSIAEGIARPVHAESADLLPTLADTGRTSLDRSVGDQMVDRLESTLLQGRDELAANERGITDQALAALADQQPTEYLWVWGFYAAPLNEFPPHFDLDGWTTTEPETDPAFANDGGWPEGDFYQPGDHIGCSCELVAQVNSALGDLIESVE